MHYWAGSPKAVTLKTSAQSAKWENKCIWFLRNVVALLRPSTCHEKTSSGQNITWMILVDQSCSLAEDSPCFWIWHRRTCQQSRAAQAWRWWWWTERGLPALRSCLSAIQRWKLWLSCICKGFLTKNGNHDFVSSSLVKTFLYIKNIHSIHFHHKL